MATLIFKIKNQSQLEHIYEAEIELTKAGIKFDTGSGLDKNGIATREWELDSIEGAELKPHKGEKLLSSKEN